MVIEMECESGVRILRLRGRLVMASDPEYLRSWMDRIRILDTRTLLVDVSEVPSICSTVIGFLVDLYTLTTGKSGGRFTLAGANSRVREVLELTRLSTIIPSAADTASGLAALRGELCRLPGE